MRKEWSVFGRSTGFIMRKASYWMLGIVLFAAVISGAWLRLGARSAAHAKMPDARSSDSSRESNTKPVPPPAPGAWSIPQVNPTAASIPDRAPPVAVAEPEAPPASAPAAPSKPARELRGSEMADILDARFYGQDVTSKWTIGALPAARRVGEVLGKTARVTSVDCRAAMCRVAATQPSLDAFRTSVIGAFQQGEADWHGPFMATIVSDPAAAGDLQTVVYLAQEGVDLSPESMNL